MIASVTIPLSQAIQRATQIAFHPFDLNKWLVMGFAAWLAMLGEGGTGFHFSMPGRGTGGGPLGPGGGPGPGAGQDPFKPIWQWLAAHLTTIILVGAAAAVLVIGLTLLLLWIRSRATFVFLDNLARNEAAIVAPWKESRPLGNSLFLFWVALSVTALACYLVVACLGMALAWPDFHARHFSGYAIAAIAASVLMFLLVALTFGIISWCTHNFVVPLMYVRQQTIVPAWQEFRAAILPGNVGTLVLFCLLQFAVRMAIGMIVLMLGCATCCIGFLPYLGTVIALPLHIFDRCYSVYFLEQFGPQYRLFYDIAEPAGASPFAPPPFPPNAS